MGFQKANENGLHGFGKLVVWHWNSVGYFLKEFELTMYEPYTKHDATRGLRGSSPHFCHPFFENTNVIKRTISLTSQPPLFQAPPHNLLGGAVPVQNNAINNVSKLLEAQGFQVVKTMKFTFFYKKL